MPTFSNIGVDEPTTIDLRVETVDIVQGATTVRREVVALGDSESSLGIAAVLGTGPASTTFGLAVREVVPTTIVAISSLSGAVIMRSSAADALVSAGQSGVWTISSLAGAVIARSSAADFAASVQPVAGSTFTTRPLQSSAADLQMTATPLAGSTWIISHGQTDSTSASGRMASSGDLSIFSSSANRLKVFAYSLIHNSTTPNQLRFLSGSTNEIWRIVLQTPSSAGPTITGANLAVGMPAHLFRTATGAALVLNAESTGAVYSIGAFREST